MKHYMIDLETMGIRPTSAIVSIGIVHFDQEKIIDQFYTNVSLADCLERGLTRDQSTVEWWAKQSVEARAAWQDPDAPKLEEALILMSRWMGTHGNVKENAPWGNGADFDLVLLKNAYEAIDADPPWQFYNHHCFRTIKNLFPVGAMQWRGTHHNALDDAVYQTQWLHRILAVHTIELT